MKARSGDIWEAFVGERGEKFCNYITISKIRINNKINKPSIKVRVPNNE